MINPLPGRGGHDYPGGRLLKGDCEQWMQRLPEGSVDLVFADLPYGITDNHWDSLIDLPTFWKNLERLTTDSTVPIILTATQPFATDLINSKREWFRCEWIWKKNRPSRHLKTRIYPLRAHENVLVFSEGSLAYFPQYFVDESKAEGPRRKDQKQTSSNWTKLKHDEYVTAGNPGVRCPTTILAVNCETGLHPTQKPVPLLDYLIRAYSRPNALVLDPTMGSGTTAIACINTRRRFIGIEKTPKIYQDALERIEQHLKELEKS